MHVDGVTTRQDSRGSTLEVFLTFLRLGLTSFGGPIAHLGYFHRELVERRQWVDPALYAQLVALCQFLPGPASSQLGFALGLIRAGWRGALLAFLAFTLPSAALLFAFAHALPLLDHDYGRAATHGLKLVAVVVVAQGVWTMARRLTPDATRAFIAISSAGAVLWLATAWSQLLVIAAGAVLGWIFCRPSGEPTHVTISLPHGRGTSVCILIAFVMLLAAAIVGIWGDTPLLGVAAAFYRAGALVFGGGHVVLPLLEEAVVTPGWITADTFLAGYGAAQAVPGPLFSISAFLGAHLTSGPGGLTGAAVALLAIFLPGFLLVAGTLPWWRGLVANAAAANAVAGVNAAVVGLLAAALYDPLWISAIHHVSDVVIVAVALLLVLTTRLPLLAVVALCVAATLLGMRLL